MLALDETRAVLLSCLPRLSDLGTLYLMLFRGNRFQIPARVSVVMPQCAYPSDPPLPVSLEHATCLRPSECHFHSPCRRLPRTMSLLILAAGVDPSLAGEST